MTWKVRHQGSPQSVQGLTLAEIIIGLRDGVWEPTDEVMGPTDRQWVAIENHPNLIEVAADIEPPPPREHEDETRLDMNALIDVCLVLLIFFILTTTYDIFVAKTLPLDRSEKKDNVAARVDEIEKFMIFVQANQNDRKCTIKVEGKEIPAWQEATQEVDRDRLQGELEDWVQKSRKREMMLFANGISWGTAIAIQDAAKGAGINRIHYGILEKEAATPK
jgi:biopolymer transport protein ExbD